MRLLLALFLLLPLGARAQHEMHDHELPVGTGAAADGGAWLKVDVTGLYLIHNAVLVGFKDDPKMLKLLVVGRVYRVLPHKGPLIWTMPGSKERSIVPKENLIPPMTVKK